MAICVGHVSSESWPGEECSHLRIQDPGLASGREESDVCDCPVLEDGQS